MILPAQTIRKLSEPGVYGAMVSPFCERTRENGLTYGLSCAGYDVRIAQTVWVWPLFGRLASIVEYIDLPRDVTAEIKDKSTWARRFVTVQNTTAEPGWRGWLTIELTRHRPWPVRIKRGTAIAQVVFKRLEHATEQPYEGKYQDQHNAPQPPIWEKQSRC